MMALLGEVDESLQSHESTLDNAAANRIAQIRAEIETLMKQGRTYGTDFNNATTAQREGFAEDALGVVQHAALLTREFGVDASGEVNKTLVASSGIVQALPLSKKMQPFILGVTPVSVKHTDLKAPIDVRAYAFIPSQLAQADIKVQLGEQQLEAKRFADGKIGFRIPAGALKADGLNTFEVVLTKRGIFRPRDVVAISGDIQVENAWPYTCAISVISKNPAAEAQVAGSWRVTAGKSERSVVKTLSATELFTASAPDPAKYDHATAKLLSAKGRVTYRRKPCSCGNEPAAKITRWTADGLSVSLSAPTTKAHKMCGKGFKRHACGGGSSAIHLTVTPIFSVAVAGARSTLVGSRETITMPRRGAQELKISDPDWKEISALCAYQNGPTGFSQVASLRRGEVTSVVAPLVLKHNGEQVFLSTTY